MVVNMNRRTRASSNLRQTRQVKKVNRVEKRKIPAKQINNGKTLIIAQEIKFARLLASNDKKVRDKVLKNLRRWLTARSESSHDFTETDFLRLWKGLFYCMWMSDKPLVQEELAESLSKIVHCFTSMETVLLYIKCTLKSLSTEWFGIDQYRIDKFEMLTRKIIRQTFVMLKKSSWDLNWVKGFGNILENLLIDKSSSLGLILHITSIYMEELAKISNGDVPEEIVTEFARPFAIYLAGLNEERQIRPVMKHIFRYLIFQSDVGIDYLDKFEAWKEAGFPCGSIKDIKKIVISSDEESGASDDEEVSKNKSEKPLDPRAGRVDVEIPQIPFSANEIANLLMQYKFHKSSTTKARRQIVRLINEFNELCKGEMPIGVKEVQVPKKRKSNVFSKRATMRLLEFQDELYSDSNNQQRKRKCPKQELLESIAENETTKQMRKDKKSKRQKIANNSQINLEEIKSKKLKVKIKSKKSNLKNKLKKKNSKVNRSFLSDSFSVNDIDIGDGEEMNTSRYSTSNGWNVSSANISVSALEGADMWVVIEKLKQNENVETVVQKEALLEKRKCSTPEKTVDVTSPTRTPAKFPEASPEKRKCITSKKIVVTSPTKTRSKSPEASSTIKIMKSPSKSSAKILKTPPVKSLVKSLSQTEPKKRVKIMLQRNTAQHTSEYFRQLRQSPQIPYDANRKPLAGVLKPSPLPSPINPFYKRNSL